MAVRARRLAEFRRRTEGKVWQKQDNGEWWLVSVHANTPIMGKGDDRRPADPRNAIDCSRGHALPDVKGKCWRCGEQIAAPRPTAEQATG